MSAVEELYEEGKGLSQRAEELFAERNRLKEEARQLKVEYQSRIDELKAEAGDLAEAFRELYRESQAAYESGDSELAKELSVEGREKQDECEDLNEEVKELIAEMRERVNELYREANEKHEEALSCIRAAEQLRGKARMMKKEGWRTSRPHRSDSMGGRLHTDTEKYDERGRKIKDAGKLKVSGEKHDPSMRDVYPPKK